MYLCRPYSLQRIRKNVLYNRVLISIRLLLLSLGLLLLIIVLIVLVNYYVVLAAHLKIKFIGLLYLVIN